jgi:hypothetical protein
MHIKVQQATVHWLVLAFFFVTLILVAACTSAPTPPLPDETAVANAGTNTAGTAIAEAIAALPTSEPIVVESTRLVEVTREVPVTRVVEVVVTATPEPTPEAVPEQEAYEITAAEVLISLIEAGLPIGDYIAYTVETDPNELLGRPGGYVSKVNFQDTRLTQQSTDHSVRDGGSIEVYPDAAGAEGRSEYIKALGQVFSPSVEYHFLAKNVLLRLSHRLLPAQAEEYNLALETLAP